MARTRLKMVNNPCSALDEVDNQFNELWLSITNVNVFGAVQR